MYCCSFEYELELLYDVSFARTEAVLVAQVVRCSCVEDVIVFIQSLRCDARFAHQVVDSIDTLFEQCKTFFAKDTHFFRGLAAGCSTPTSGCVLAAIQYTKQCRPCPPRRVVI